MAGLQRAPRRTEGFVEPARGFAEAGRRVAEAPARVEFLAQDNVPGARPPPYMARPRIGPGARPAPRRRRRKDGTLLLRVLGTAAAMLILGIGALLAFHVIGPVHTPPPPVAVAAAPAKPPHEVVARRAAAAAAILPIPAKPAPVAEPGPTAADFARPAFLEPVAPSQSGPAQVEAKVEPDAAPPAAAAPLPPPRPKVVDAGAEKTAGNALIRSSVTMRSGPRRAAPAIGTLARGTKVTLYSCKSWCEVASGDKRGFVYKNAVSR